MSDIPDDLCDKLIARGHKILDVGNATLILATGVWTREIKLDDETVGIFEFPSDAMDWNVVEKALL